MFEAAGYYRDPEFDILRDYDADMSDYYLSDEGVIEADYRGKQQDLPSEVDGKAKLH